MRQLRLIFPATDVFNQLPVLWVVIKYAVLGAMLIFFFQFLALYILIYPGNIYLILSTIILASGILGCVLSLRSCYLDKKYQTDPLQLLSKREREVCLLLLTDKSNKEICELLFIEKSTLKSHINSIYKKLNVQDRQSLKDRISN